MANNQPQAKAQLVLDNGQIKVSGELTFATVPYLRLAGDSLITKCPQLIFDFSAVTHTDSASLALLTAWTRKAKQLKKTLQFIRLPQQLFEIARVSGLDKILPIEVETV
jgi:phospholipid transport system transporter-binding protein